MFVLFLFQALLFIVHLSVVLVATFTKMAATLVNVKMSSIVRSHDYYFQRLYKKNIVSIHILIEAVLFLVD